MTESEYFNKMKEIQLNKLGKSVEEWTVDVKYVQQAQDALMRLKYEMEEGILLKMRAHRMKQLDSYVASNCYRTKDYNFIQGQTCEKFHYENDFKLGIIDSFFSDHIVKHLANYEQCWANKNFLSLKTVAEKDRSFLECHKKWIRSLKEEVPNELEFRARNLLE